jgi:hypothetical protein
MTAHTGRTETGTAPVRIQRRRAKGWKMPPNTVYVGRGTEFGNPFTLDEAREFHEFMPPDNGDTPRETAIRWFSEWLAGVPVDIEDRPPSIDRIALLRGRNLACWCALDQPCHADVLLEIANADPARSPAPPFA